jgi:hypothetical protein
MDSDALATIHRAFDSQETRDAVSALTRDRRDRLHRYWLDRADGELTTALSFEFVLADLEVEGAPATLLDLARRTIEEEHQHTDICVRWAALLRPEEPARAHFRGTRPASFEGASAHDDRLLRPVFAGLSETVAVHVLHRSQERTTLPAVRLLNQIHIKEELDHARLGWALLAWPELGDPDRKMVAGHVPELISLLRTVWLETERPADSALEELGFLSTPLIATAIDEAIEGVILPGLAHHGIR